MRLFCFPYAGAGASSFRTWPGEITPSVEVCSVQLPGRENRIREVPFSQIPALMDDLVRGLLPSLAPPFALFGHSLGAFIAFELARRLREMKAPGPVHLLVSGQRAPQRPDILPPICQLSDADFIAEVSRRYDAFPKAVLESAEMMEFLLPLLRADFLMAESYSYIEGPPLDCPITCFGGRQDPEATTEDLSAWQDQTSGPFDLRMFPGGHFFLRDQAAPFFEELNQQLENSAQGGF